VESKSIGRRKPTDKQLPELSFHGDGRDRINPFDVKKIQHLKSKKDPPKGTFSPEKAIVVTL